MTTEQAIREVLAGTTMPGALVDELVTKAPMTWLMGEPAEGVAADLALCHPPLGPDEVRAAAWPTTAPGVWKVTVVAHDHPGLLAAVAGTIAEHGLSMGKASASVWPDLDLAMQRVTIQSPTGAELNPADWDALGQRLRQVVSAGAPVRTSFSPMVPVTVDAQPQAVGRAMVTVTAPDRVGLLWAIASWLAEHDCNIEACRAEVEGSDAVITMLVAGEADYRALAGALSDAPTIERSRRVSRLPRYAGAAAAAAVAMVWRRRRAVRQG